jgi:glutamate racemase
MDQDAPIAVFDSGVGGISVLRALRKVLPQEHFLYFGDSLHAPYGSRPTAQVQQLTMDAAHRLLDQGAKALVIACNTATAAAVETVRAAYPHRIIVGIEPALKLAVERHPGGRIAVFATDVTLREGKFAALLARYSRECQVTCLPLTGVVELVEQDRADTPEARALLSRLLSPLAGQVDAAVLGCTHYPFVKKAIAAALGEQTELLDGGEGTARETKRRLEEAHLLRQGTGSVTLENSLPGEEMLQLCRKLLDMEE